jgi:hypothetical protein
MPSMHSVSIFTTAPYKPSDVPLGSLVPDIRYPNQDALDCVNELSQGPEISNRPQANFKGALGEDSSRSVLAQITKLLTLSHSRKKNQSLDIGAKTGWIYELKHPKQVFEELCKRDGVRTWLREGVSANFDSYFVVGVRTFKEAKVSKGEEKSSETGLDATVPVSEAIKANSGVDVGDAADLKLKGEDKKKVKGEESFDVDEEMIYAIEYRKIKVNMKIIQQTKETKDAKGKDGDKDKDNDEGSIAKLGRDNTWRFYYDNRIAGEDAALGEEYEAELEEEDVNLPEGYEVVADQHGDMYLVPPSSEQV